MSAPRAISVLIDTYQQGRFVARAVESVLMQTHPAHEIVVVDDGSTDDTASELARFGDRIRVLRQSNQGQAGALNEGLAALTGPWVAFLDGDDAWETQHLELIAAATERDAECDAVFAPMRRIDDQDRLLSLDPPDAVLAETRQTLTDPAAARAGLMLWFPPTSGLACRRDLLLDAGPIPLDYRISADGWVQVVLAVRARRIALIGERSVRLRVHLDNRWTGRDELDSQLLTRRRDLYERLAAAVGPLARAHHGYGAHDVDRVNRVNADGLATSLASQAAEFAIWELFVQGHRGAALALALRWTASPALPSTWHRAFRRVQLVLATLVPARWYLALRRAWRLRIRPRDSHSASPAAP